jgi:CRP/FNR family transcriptional regulator
MGFIPLFEGLSEERRGEIAAITLKKIFQKDETIFSEGAPGTGFYVATRGKVKIFKLSPEGKEQILHIFGPGEPFGEVPVFEGRNFPANALALEPTEALFFPRDALKDLIKRNPELSMAMLAVLSKRLRVFTVMVDNLSLKEVPARLSAHILYLSEMNGVVDQLELDMPKTQLAALIGTIPETLSRIFARMANEGILKTSGKKVTIMDKRALRDLAEGRSKLS